MVIENALPALSLYIHFPWCIRKCPYCDFNSHEAKASIPEERYIDALLKDLSQDLAMLAQPRELTSIFMGGGTPSLFSPKALHRLLDEINLQIRLSPDCEITLEANPGSFESAKFNEFRALGINRLSIGIQSFNERHLKKLGRVHNAAEAIHAIEIAQTAGFDNFNLDLMFGLPEQTEAEAISDMNTAISLNPTHISFYQLTLEPNTYFHRFPPKLPEDDAIYQAQLSCQELLAKHGYRQYEISAYAIPGFQCRHNRNYWKFGDYLGIGAGAHGKISIAKPDNIVRTMKTKHPEHYLQNPGTTRVEAIQPAHLPLEFVMNHLRLRDGFHLNDFQKLTGLNCASLEPGLSDNLAEKLLINQQQQIFCTQKGWDFLDVVLGKFLA